MIRIPYLFVLIRRTNEHRIGLCSRVSVRNFQASFVFLTVVEPPGGRESRITFHVEHSIGARDCQWGGEMTYTVERPVLDIVNEEKPSDEALQQIQNQLRVELATPDERLFVLWRFLAERDTRLRLTRYAFRFTHNYEDAEDVASGAILRAVPYIDKLKQRTKPVLLAYLFKTIRHLAFDERRKRKSMHTLLMQEGGLSGCDEEEVNHCSVPGPEDAVRFQIEDQCVWATFMKIPKASRQVAWLRFICDCDVETIAQTLCITKKTVYKHVERARKVFQPHFQREGGAHD